MTMTADIVRINLDVGEGFTVSFRPMSEWSGIFRYQIHSVFSDRYMLY